MENTNRALYLRRLFRMLLVVVFLAVSLFVFLNITSQRSNPLTSPQTEVSKEPAKQRMSVEIYLSANGFTPALIKVPVGTRVTWISKTTSIMLIESSEDSPEKIKQPIARSDYTFTFEKKGVYKYFNKSNPSVSGKLEVE